MRTESRHSVARAWRHNYSETGANVSTNGRDVFSYAHVVGTTENGYKIAYDCHYSPTTAKHCSAFKAQADQVLDSCPSCGS